MSDYFKTCPYCGVHLDPGESCDCQDNEKAACVATNNTDGEGGTDLTGPVSASSINENGGNVK